MSTEWRSKKRSKIDTNSIINHLVLVDAPEHPLKTFVVTVLDSRGNSRKTHGLSVAMKEISNVSFNPLNIALDGIDPLNQFAKETNDGILSQMNAEFSSNSKNVEKKKFQRPHNVPLIKLIEPWTTKRIAILNKYTTSEKLSIVTSFLSDGEIIKASTAVSEKTKYRLEQIDDVDKGSIQHMMDLTQQEYVCKIEQLNQELIQAWSTDQRVKSLKIAIQCSKFLADTSVMHFYPSKFVLITDILDIFGKLVFDRLKAKSAYIDPISKETLVLPEQFTPEMVPDSAKETCLNWFYKISSIRELLPRLYIEIAILKSYTFLTTTQLTHTLFRLTRMIRGIGDPLVAVYARCYLCRIGMSLTSETNYLKENVNDFLAVYHTLFSAGIKTEMSRQRIDILLYFGLYVPALEWIIHGMAVNADDALLEEILNKCHDKKNNGLLLQIILTSFRADFIAPRALSFIQVLSSSNTEGVRKSQLFRSLGSVFSVAPPAAEQRQEVLKNIWNIISTFTDPAEYISCIETWSLYIAKYFESREIDLILGAILSHMAPKRAYEIHYLEIHTIIDNIITNYRSIECLLVLDNFLSILDLFNKESMKLEICERILTVFMLNCSDRKISDAVLINALMYISKNLSDSINALTVEDERRKFSSLINSFIESVSFGNDFEQQLSFYVDSRAAFQTLDGIISTLIHSVNNLAMETRRKVRGQHSRKTSAFVKACAAYCFITIPSIVSAMTRLDLYLLSGQVALINLCIGQADACLEAAINTIPELPNMIEITDGRSKSTETYLTSYISNVLSTLIIVPDNPGQGVLYLLRLLLENLKKYEFDSNSSSLPKVYLNVLAMLSVAAQEDYPYHIPNLMSNDELYGSDIKFISEIDTICSEIVDEILYLLKALGDAANQTNVQIHLSVELFMRIITSADIKNEKMFALAVNLWNLAAQNTKVLDPNLLMCTLELVERHRNKTKNKSLIKIYDELIVQMKTKI